MPVNYDGGAKASRMNATRLMVAGGTLELCTSDGAAMAAFKLTASAGSVREATWTLQFESDNVQSLRQGRASIARIKDSGGTVRVSGLTVGMGKADVNISNTQVNDRQTVSLEGEQSITHA